MRVLLERRGDEPPTESFPETRMLQLLEDMKIRPWRQVRVVKRRKIVYRIDLVAPFDPSAARPSWLRSDDGLGIEVDSRQHHERRFEEDHDRQAVYDSLGLHWIVVTPNQIEQRPHLVREAVLGALRRAAA